jgi:hypothetical protein
MLRRLSDKEFCSAGHQKAYLQEQEELALQRLMESRGRGTVRQKELGAGNALPSRVSDSTILPDSIDLLRDLPVPDFSAQFAGTQFDGTEFDGTELDGTEFDGTELEGRGLNAAPSGLGAGEVAGAADLGDLRTVRPEPNLYEGPLTLHSSADDGALAEREFGRSAAASLDYAATGHSIFRQNYEPPAFALDSGLPGGDRVRELGRTPETSVLVRPMGSKLAPGALSDLDLYDTVKVDLPDLGVPPFPDAAAESFVNPYRISRPEPPAAPWAVAAREEADPAEAGWVGQLPGVADQAVAPMRASAEWLAGVAFAVPDALSVEVIRFGGRAEAEPVEQAGWAASTPDWSLPGEPPASIQGPEGKAVLSEARVAPTVPVERTASPEAGREEGDELTMADLVAVRMPAGIGGDAGPRRGEPEARLMGIYSPVRVMPLSLAGLAPACIDMVPAVGSSILRASAPEAGKLLGPELLLSLAGIGERLLHQEPAIQEELAPLEVQGALEAPGGLEGARTRLEAEPEPFAGGVILWDTWQQKAMARERLKLRPPVYAIDWRLDWVDLASAPVLEPEVLVDWAA